MFSFAHLIDRVETHDVIFLTQCKSGRVGFCKTLLLGVSEVWNSRDEHWQENKDEEGRVYHFVDLDPDSAQDVLNALQSAVFTGTLPECSWQVLLQVARLADAELMTGVIDLVETALLDVKALDGLQEQVHKDIRSIEAAVGHITQLQNWVCLVSEKLAVQMVVQLIGLGQPIDQLPGEEGELDMGVFIDLLTELPPDSPAALGVLRAAWSKLLANLPYPGHPEHKTYCEAILRHEQILLCNPDVSFLTDATLYVSEDHVELRKVLAEMAHSLLGSPAEAINSDKALEEFCEKFPKKSSTSDLWSLYIDKFDKDFVRLLHKVQQRQEHPDDGPLHGCYLGDETVHLLCGGKQGLSLFSGSELRNLLLPVLNDVHAKKTLIDAVEVMVDLDTKRLHERRLRKQLEQQLQQQQAVQQGQGRRLQAAVRMLAAQADDNEQQQQQLLLQQQHDVIEQREHEQQGRRGREREEDDEDAGDAALQHRQRRRILIEEDSDEE